MPSSVLRRKYFDFQPRKEGKYNEMIQFSYIVICDQCVDLNIF